MSYIKLAEAKSFLNVYFDEKDAEIQTAIDGAEDIAAEFLGRPLSDLVLEDSPPADSPGAAELRPGVKVEILRLVSELWQNREVHVIGASIANNPMHYQNLHFFRTGLGV